MKSYNQFFGVLSKVVCCLCAVVLCVCCLSSETYGWYCETVQVSGIVQFGQWKAPPVNLLTNGDFSNGLTGWKSSNSSGNTIEVVDGYLKLQRITGKAPNVTLKTAGTYPAGTYTFSGKVLVSGEEGCATAQIDYSFKNSGGTIVSDSQRYTFNGDNLPPAMTWTDFSFDVVIPEGETAVELNVSLKHTLKAVGYICYDDISVIQKQS